MTTNSILILSGIVSAFLLFGGVLAWGDFYSRRRRDDQVSVDEQKPSEVTAVIVERKAA